jgi:hypothetical protein
MKKENVDDQVDRQECVGDFIYLLKIRLKKRLRLVLTYSGKKPKDHFFVFESSTTIRLVKIVS